MNKQKNVWINFFLKKIYPRMKIFLKIFLRESAHLRLDAYRELFSDRTHNLI